MPANLRFNARRDANEPALLKTFRKLGGVWHSTGPLDGWAGARGRWVPTEIKLPHLEGRKDEFTEVQRDFMQECAMNGQPYQIWRTDGDVVRFVCGAP